MTVAFRRHRPSASRSHLVARPNSRRTEKSFDSDADADDDDADLPSLRQILASPKRVIEVIDLTCDGDGGSEGDDGGKEWQPEGVWL